MLPREDMAATCHEWHELLWDRATPGKHMVYLAKMGNGGVCVCGRGERRKVPSPPLSSQKSSLCPQT